MSKQSHLIRGFPLANLPCQFRVQPAKLVFERPDDESRKEPYHTPPIPEILSWASSSSRICSISTWRAKEKLNNSSSTCCRSGFNHSEFPDGRQCRRFKHGQNYVAVRFFKGIRDYLVSIRKVPFRNDQVAGIGPHVHCLNMLLVIVNKNSRSFSIQKAVIPWSCRMPTARA